MSCHCETSDMIQQQNQLDIIKYQKRCYKQHVNLREIENQKWRMPLKIGRPELNCWREILNVRIHWEGSGTPLQYSRLENPMDGGAWWAAVHGVVKSWALSDFTFTFHFHASEKEMATHSSVLAWRIPGTGEPSGLPSMESHRVGHDWSSSRIHGT